MNTNDFKFDVQKVIRESPRKKCECGNEYFNTSTVQIEVSSLLSNTGKSEILLVGVLVCAKCGKENIPRQIQPAV